MSSSTTIARNPAQSARMIFLFSWQIGQVPWERVNSLVTSKAEVAFLTWDGLTFDRLGGLPVAAPLYYGTDVDEEGLPRRFWIDPDEDGLNGNEALAFSMREVK